MPSFERELNMKPLVEAARGGKPSRYPIWFMRQAGRYLPEYLEVRSRVEFVEACQTPAISAELTLQPMKRYDLDAAIIFSDILVPCVGMGQTLTFGKGHGPQLSNVVRSPKDLAALKGAECVDSLKYVGEGIAKTKAGLRPEQTMIGFAGAPLTVASYMIEGAGSKTYSELKKLIFTQPEVFAGLLDKLREVTVEYLAMQVEAGADYLMLFDSWGAQLASEDYRGFVAPNVNRLITELKSRVDVPIAYFPGAGMDRLYDLGECPADVIHIHWCSRMDAAINLLKQSNLDVSVQGNLDPQVLLGTEDFVRERTRAVLRQAEQARGHIFNVGHGLMPHIPPEALNWVISEVRNYKG